MTFTVVDGLILSLGCMAVLGFQVAEFRALWRWRREMRERYAPKEIEADPLIVEFRKLEQEVAERERRERQATCPHDGLTYWRNDPFTRTRSLVCAKCGADPIYIRFHASPTSDPATGVLRRSRGV